MLDGLAKSLAGRASGRSISYLDPRPSSRWVIRRRWFMTTSPRRQLLALDIRERPKADARDRRVQPLPQFINDHHDGYELTHLRRIVLQRND